MVEVRSFRSVAAVLALAVIAASWMLSACGGKQSSVASPQSHQRQGYGGQASDRSDGLQTADSLDDALVELKAYPCPEGVDEELWVELKEALEGALLTQMESRLSSRDSIGNN
jgi:hypothetical protein